MNNFERKQLLLPFLLAFIYVCAFPYPLSANPLDPIARSQISVHVYYADMLSKHQEKSWDKLAWRSRELIAEFPFSPFAKEALYYLGVAKFMLKEYESANIVFSKYLKEEALPKYFDQTIRYKFSIASEFDGGEKAHLFGLEKLPKIISAYDTALEIYDEVIAAMPRDEIAAQSLYKKGQLLVGLEEFSSSIEAFQILCRRFPKHNLTPKAYIGIIGVYIKECQKDYPDENKLQLAEICYKKFERAFPKEPLLIEAKQKIQILKEVLAQDLFEIAFFYNKTKKQSAAKIYFENVIKKYPGTNAAKKSQEILDDHN